MSLKIASWNNEGRLSDDVSKKRGNPDSIINAIKTIDADILLLLEAHSESSIDDLGPHQQLIDAGYHIYNVPYEDDMKQRVDAYTSELSLMLLTKLPVEEFEIIRLGKLRNALTAVIKDPKTSKTIQFIGVHLDDRSELTRLRQVADLSEIINQSKAPTIVAGDFNAMHGRDVWPSKLLRSDIIKLMARFVIPSLSIRATEMARGEALALLEKSTGLIDIDEKHQATETPKNRHHEWLPSIRLIQIDHIFASSNVKTSKFKVMPDFGADHRAITATIEI
jgi:endonuclease/exonuclease/phosphatase family metal-dependent hydrolase